MYHRVKRGSSMKKSFIVANWKSNLTSLEANEWLVKIANSKLQIVNSDDKEVIVCPPFTLLKDIESGIKNYELGFKVGTQNISPFDEGAYTGEISAKQAKEFADYVIIGHSERRKNFLESDEVLFKKAELANKYGLTPIFCVQDATTKIPENVEIVAYEPVFAIGTGNSDTPENAEEIAIKIKTNKGVISVLYGGSVTSKNIKGFTQMPNIDGVLVGGASLDAQEFYAIIQNS